MIYCDIMRFNSKICSQYKALTSNSIQWYSLLSRSLGSWLSNPGLNSLSCRTSVVSVSASHNSLPNFFYLASQEESLEINPNHSYCSSAVTRHIGLIFHLGNNNVIVNIFFLSYPDQCPGACSNWHTESLTQNFPESKA